ncbi:MAG TPA: SRPBCC family protein [Fimbriimonas sp.]|nr:SRPBCC family protein [Fimbriimonas sp.]
MTPVGQLEVTLPSDREIEMTRVFDAPRDLVFEAFTNPELLLRWFHGPDGWTLVVCEVDLRPGGAYRYVWNGPGGIEMGMGGTFVEVNAPDRFVALEKFDQAWYEGEGHVTTTLTEADGKTTYALRVRYDSKEIRDGVLQSPMKEGVGVGLDRLAAMLPTFRQEKSK